MFHPKYKEMAVKTTIIDFDGNYVPDLPISNAGLLLVYCDNRNHFAYPLPASCLGKDAICHVVYRVQDHSKMQGVASSDKLGQGNDVCNTLGYKKVNKKTVGSVSIAEEKARLISEAESLGQTVPQSTLDAVKYDKADKDEGHPEWVFLTKSYVDG